MATATVTLKTGKSYTVYDGSTEYKFTEKPSNVSGDDFIARLKTVSVLAVEVHEDAPVAPLKKQFGFQKKPVAPAAEPEPDWDQMAADEGGGEDAAPPPPKAPAKGGFKPGNKPGVKKEG